MAQREQQPQARRFGLAVGLRPGFLGLSADKQNKEEIQEKLKLWQKRIMGSHPSSSGVLTKDVGATTKAATTSFHVRLDLRHYLEEEISIKISEGILVIEAIREEREDEHGFLSMRLKRTFEFPKYCNPEAAFCLLSEDGLLTLVAPPLMNRVTDRVIPITRCGPQRDLLMKKIGEVAEAFNVKSIKDAIDPVIPNIE